MSIQSMTGYGRFEQSFESGKYSAEIKSVNNRYAEIQCRLPRVFNPLELQIRKLLDDRLVRGSINLNVNFEAAQGAVEIGYDEKMLDSYAEIFSKMSQRLGGGEIKDISLLSPFFRDLIVSKPVEFSLEVLTDELISVIEKAIEALIEERKREGAALAEFFVKSFGDILQNVEKIEKYAPQRIEKYRERLHTAVEMLQKEGVDEQRIALEVVMLVEKLDITEEITRLKTHISATKALLGEPNQNVPLQAVGKKLGFWLQEINREINTIGSKANDSAIAEIVVSMKDAAEQMREQSLNLL